MGRKHLDEGADQIPTVVRTLKEDEQRVLSEDMVEELTERPTEAGRIDHLETEPVAVRDEQEPPKPSSTGLELADLPRPSKPIPMYPVEEIVCPKCGRTQPPGGATCVRCGVIFNKAHLPTEKRPPRKEAPAPRGLSGVIGKAPAHDGPSFWTSVPQALAVPFMGAGVLWLPLMMVVLVGARFMVALPALIPGALIAVAAYLGLVAAYFRRAFQLGVDGTPRAPDLPSFADPKNDYVVPGVALFVLCSVLFALPAFTLAQALTASGLSGAAHDAAGPRVEAWDPEEVFGDGAQVVKLKPGDAPRSLRRADGETVRVDPGAGTITYTSAAVAAVPSERRSGHWILVALAALIPLLYWPMALALAALGGGMRVLDAPAVLKGAIKGGRHYAFVAVMGSAIVVGGTSFAVMAALSMTTTRGVFEVLAGLIAVTLGFLAYVSAVQGYLMGRLVERRHVRLDTP